MSAAPGKSRRRPRKQPVRKAGYREYLERCAAAGDEPSGFEEYLEAARRWRLGYREALAAGDLATARELEGKLCMPRPQTPRQRREA